MARLKDAVCKLCRREKEKLFLKGLRCFTDKCGVTKKPYVPGQKAKMRLVESEYYTQLREKQKAKRMYGILEKQFRNHFEEVKGKKGITGDLLLARLEMRLDNVVYRMGLASSRALARQLVNHGLISVNGKKVSIPSYEVKVGQTIGINNAKQERNYFKTSNNY